MSDEIFARRKLRGVSSPLSETPSRAASSPPLTLISDRHLTRIFGAGGQLALFMKARGRDFEARAEQLAMAKAIADAVRDRTHLLVEAGTGVGKSYAYLIPLLLWALESRKRVLVATGTKALQQQLVERDLPFLSELFQSQLGLEFKYALCLGTGNYICPRRLAKAQVAGLFASPEEVEQLEQLHAFAQKETPGRNLDLPFDPKPGLWAQVNREGDLCLGRNCPLFEDSFYWKARREADKAQILVANHHLLFAHIAAGGNAGGVLPPFDALVIDEAHHAEDVAASYLGLEISNLSAARLIELISSRRAGKTVISSVGWTKKAELEEQINNAANAAREGVGRFFENLQLAVRFEQNRSSTKRITRPNLLEDCISEPFDALETALARAHKIAEAEGNEELTRELEGYAKRCGEIQRAARTLVEHSAQGYVYWAQSTPRPTEFGGAPRVPRLSLHGAPIEVANSLRTNVFEKFKPTILTSATLTTGGDFDFLIERLGLSDPAEEPEKIEDAEEQPQPSPPQAQSATAASTESNPQKSGPQEASTPDSSLPAPEIRTLALGSPFDYPKNALVYVGSDLPDPVNQTFWEEAVVKRVAEIVKRTDGRAFVLCTSYKMVDKVAGFLERVMPRHIRVLRQGSGSRGRLLRDFREDVHSVLVGTTSFWQGVDVPGESLSCVVITKLPFAVPDEPLVQARVETLKSRGRDAFSDYQVPQAVMLFRQGFGRLIRTAHDRGVVAILDPRVKSKEYGKTFLESLPPCEVTSELERLSLFMSL